MTAAEYITLMFKNPMLFVSTFLTLSVIFVNGWTDAPNAIATCVSTRSISVKKAIVMAAVFNFAGVFVMTAVNTSVATTIFNIADFGGDASLSITALCAAMSAIVIWSVATWYFGIPTSESHSLIAGISGAAVALNNRFSSISAKEWSKVIFGIVLSTFLGFVSGFVISRLTETVFCRCNRVSANRFFIVAQICGGAATAFMHGAQDGQKFIAVCLMGAAFSNGDITSKGFDIPIWLMITCSVIMGLGTSVGGRRIIKFVGMSMVRLKPYQGFSADFAAAFCLLFSSFTGMPVSTTHTKTTAIMGVGAARGINSVNWSVVKSLVFTWVVTFPGCGILGFLTAKLFLALF